MGVLQRFERRLGGMVEGAFARVFKGGVEPVELAGALTRECDERRARGAKRTLVPNDFTIHLSDPDFERLAPYRQALSDELATLVREHAAAQRYTFVAPVVVHLELDAELSVGRYLVRSDVVGSPAVHGRRSAAGSARHAGGRRASAVLSGASAWLSGRAMRAGRPTRRARGPQLARLIVTVGGSAENGSPAAAGLEREVLLQARAHRHRPRL